MGTEAFKKIGFKSSNFKVLPSVARNPISYISYISFIAARRLTTFSPKPSVKLKALKSF